MKTTKKAAPLDPLIEGYLGYLDKVGRKVPRTIVDVRCTLRRAICGLELVRPGVPLWRAKTFRKVDAGKEDENGNLKEAVQVIRPNKNGTPPKREIDAARDIYNATGVKVRFVPVRPIIPKPTPQPLPPPPYL